MALAHFRMLIQKLLNKDPNIFPEKDPLTILDIQSEFCMSNIFKYTNHTSHIARIIHFVRNGENATCTGLNVLKEVCNWKTLKLRSLVRIT